jgi:hypothetical protein
MTCADLKSALRAFDRERPGALGQGRGSPEHEAGRVVAALMLDIGVRRVSIVPDETTGGRTHVRDPRWWRCAPYLPKSRARAGRDRVGRDRPLQ